MYTLDQIKKAVTSKGYAWFDDGEFNLNLVGVRNSTSGNKVTNLFDDHLTVAYKQKGIWRFHCWEATTDPGKKGMLLGKAKGGVARMVPGQYRGAYALGLHQGKYQALRQVKKVKVYRDGNRDLNFDETRVDEGLFGINIHKAGENSVWVENWSEGCQVFKRKKDFDLMMSLVKKSIPFWKNSFTYTLLESKDI